MADRSYRNRERHDRPRQAEQFDATDYGWRDEERNRGQMGEGGERDDNYGWYESGESYGRERGWRERGSSRQGEYAPSGGSRYNPDYPGRAPHQSRASEGFAPFTGSDQSGRDFSQPRYGYGAGRGSPTFPYSYDDRGYGAAPRTMYGDESDREERGFFDRAGDEVASWFGDEEAARRREMDHRGRGPAGYTRSDERILEDACDALTEDWRVDGRQIQVTVENGELTLDGTVQSRAQKRRAEDCVEDLSGVRHVQNNLRVEERPTQDRYDSGETMRSRQSEPTS
jgi:osmotically-inducible protein OsmY